MEKAKFVTLKNVQFTGITRSGTLFMESDGKSYNVEVSEENLSFLVLLLGLHFNHKPLGASTRSNA